MGLGHPAATAGAWWGGLPDIAVYACHHKDQRVGLGVKAPASRAGGPGSEFVYDGIFPGGVISVT